MFPVWPLHNRPLIRGALVPAMLSQHFAPSLCVIVVLMPLLPQELPKIASLLFPLLLMSGAQVTAPTVSVRKTFVFVVLLRLLSLNQMLPCTTPLVFKPPTHGAHLCAIKMWKIPLVWLVARPTNKPLSMPPPTMPFAPFSQMNGVPLCVTTTELTVLTVVQPTTQAYLILLSVPLMMSPIMQPVLPILMGGALLSATMRTPHVQTVAQLLKVLQ